MVSLESATGWMISVKISVGSWTLEVAVAGVDARVVGVSTTCFKGGGESPPTIAKPIVGPEVVGGEKGNVDLKKGERKGKERW